MITVSIPLQTARGQNNREHHYTRYRREQREKWAVGMFLGRYQRPAVELGRGHLVVLLTRVAPSEGLDSDNLSGSLKAVRDAVADWLGIDDKSELVRYEYAQERGPWGIRIEWKE